LDIAIRVDSLACKMGVVLDPIEAVRLMGMECV